MPNTILLILLVVFFGWLLIWFIKWLNQRAKRRLNERLEFVSSVTIALGPALTAHTLPGHDFPAEHFRWRDPVAGVEYYTEWALSEDGKPMKHDSEGNVCLVTRSQEKMEDLKRRGMALDASASPTLLELFIDRYAVDLEPTNTTPVRPPLSERLQLIPERVDEWAVVVQ